MNEHIGMLQNRGICAAQTLLQYHIYREYVHSVAVYQKYLTRLGKLMISSLGEKIIIFPNRVRYFWYTTTICTYSIYLSTSDLLGFIFCNTDQHKFSSRWKWISCFNDVINNIDCVMKRDVYHKKMHSCFKNIRGIYIFFVLKISVGYQEKIYRMCHYMGILLVER